MCSVFAPSHGEYLQWQISPVCDYVTSIWSTWQAFLLKLFQVDMVWRVKYPIYGVRYELVKTQWMKQNERTFIDEAQTTGTNWGCCVRGLHFNRQRLCVAYFTHQLWNCLSRLSWMTHSGDCRRNRQKERGGRRENEEGNSRRLNSLVLELSKPSYISLIWRNWSKWKRHLLRQRSFPPAPTQGRVCPGITSEKERDRTIQTEERERGKQKDWPKY